jgi:hypothetical protein
MGTTGPVVLNCVAPPQPAENIMTKKLQSALDAIREDIDVSDAEEVKALRRRLASQEATINQLICDVSSGILGALNSLNAKFAYIKGVITTEKLGNANRNDAARTAKGRKARPPRNPRTPKTKKHSASRH